MDHYDKCSLLLPMNGANNGVAFPDFSRYNVAPTVAGDAKTVTAVSKYYGSSGYFDGVGDQLYCDSGARFVFGTGDFTVACWVRLLDSVGGYLFSGYQQGVAGIAPNVTVPATTLVPTLIASGGTAFLTSTIALPLDEWAHFEWSRVSGVSYLFVDGVAAGSVDDTRNYGIGASRPTIATSGFAYGTNNLKCYLQDFCVWKGVGLHTSGFTPPAKRIASISGTILGADGEPAARTINVLARAWPERGFSTVSDAGDGTYSVECLNSEANRIVLADEAELYNDIVDRVMPG